MLCHDALPELGCLKLGQDGVVAAPTPTPPNFCADRTSGIWNNLAVRTLWRAFFEDNSSHVNGGLRSTQELKRLLFQFLTITVTYGQFTPLVNVWAPVFSGSPNVFAVSRKHDLLEGTCWNE